MRIVGGSLRGRLLRAPAGNSVRPTSDRVREALFNILEHADFGSHFVGLTDAIVLDAFAGTGALGIEALSRGAAQATFFESDRSARDCLNRNLADLGLTARTTVQAVDATRPPRPPTPVGLALLDPPYRTDLGNIALQALAAAGWLAIGAVAVLEQSDPAPIELPGYFLCQTRRYGGTTLVFLRWDGDGGPRRDPAL